MVIDLPPCLAAPPAPERPHTVLAAEWEASATYLKASPMTVAAAAFAAFTKACD